MRIRTYQTSMNVLLDEVQYRRLKSYAIQEGTTMSQIIRKGIGLALDEIDKENEAAENQKDHPSPWE